MKQFSKKISSFIMALAVGLSLSPATGLMLSADETETEVPEVTSEAEPEKPAETEAPKETEATKETEASKEPDAPKEIEAPKESEAPKETKTPKKPDASATSKPKNLHENTGTITGIKVTDGTLSWNKYEGAEYYYVTAYGKYIYVGNYTSIDFINDEIDRYIRSCSISKKSAYKIDIEAQDIECTTIAKGSYSYTYASSAVAAKPGKVKGAKIDKKGILKWKGHKNAMYYELYINGIECSSTEGGCWKFNLRNVINWSIESGILTKASSNKYTIKLVGYTATSTPVDQWSKTYKYKSKATPIKYYAFDYDDFTFNNGIIKWTKVPKATLYRILITDSNGKTKTCDFTSNSFDMTAFLCTNINSGDFSGYAFSFKLSAYCKYPKIAEVSMKYAFVPVTADMSGVKGNTAKVSFKNLKKKAQTLAVSKAIAGVSTPGSEGKYIFKKVSGDKAISINQDTGKITIKKKGLKKKTYSVKVKVSISESMSPAYEPMEKTITFKIRVK